jgi:hypothetical protein
MGIREDLAKLSGSTLPGHPGWRLVLELAQRLHTEYTDKELLALLAALAMSERRS